MLRTRKELSKTAVAPLTIFAAALIYALSSPQNYSNTGFLFFYPLFGDFTIMSLYTTGTWMFVFMISWVMHDLANKKFNDYAYRVLSGSSLYAYLSHYFFILVIAVTIIRPLGIPFVPAIFIEFILVNVVVFGSYMLFLLIYDLIVPPKA
jgi:hypothetical protein